MSFAISGILPSVEKYGMLATNAGAAAMAWVGFLYVSSHDYEFCITDRRDTHVRGWFSGSLLVLYATETGCAGWLISGSLQLRIISVMDKRGDDMFEGIPVDNLCPSIEGVYTMNI